MTSMSKNMYLKVSFIIANYSINDSCLFSYFLSNKQLLVTELDVDIKVVRRGQAKQRMPIHCWIYRHNLLAHNLNRRTSS
jgi:ribulose-5-phosphate 4-epimerase/fuculose-1-phosphate aldolase